MNIFTSHIDNLLKSQFSVIFGILVCVKTPWSRSEFSVMIKTSLYHTLDLSMFKLDRFYTQSTIFIGVTLRGLSVNVICPFFTSRGSQNGGSVCCGEIRKK